MNKDHDMAKLNVGDWIRVECEDVASFEKGKVKIFIGQILSIFNALSKDGDDWSIELRGKKGEWFLYKSKIDGGTVNKITVEVKNEAFSKIGF